MSYSVHQFLQAAEGQKAKLREMLAYLEQLKQRDAERFQQVATQTSQALAQLVQTLLPELTAAACERAGRVIGYGALLQGDPIGQMEADRARLAARVAELEADPTYYNRELLRAPRVGQLPRQIAELEEFRVSLRQIVELAEHVRLQRLLDVNYGTDAYAVGWWRMAYYGDWQAGDEIVTRFLDKQSFAEVRAEYLTALDSIAVYDKNLAELAAQVAAGEALEAEHARMQADLASTEARHLAKWRRDLAEHLRAVDPRSYENRILGDAELMLKTYSGLQHKLDYLENLAKSQFISLEQELRSELAKLDADLVKYVRPKKASTQFDEAKFNQRFGPERYTRWHKRYDRYTKTYDTIWSFDGYQRASFAERFLWWDVMTDGRIDGNFVPEVYEYRQMYPDHHYQRDFDDSDDVAAAAAVAMSQADDSGAIGNAFDAS